MTQSEFIDDLCLEISMTPEERTEIEADLKTVVERTVAAKSFGSDPAIIQACMWSGSVFLFLRLRIYPYSFSIQPLMAKVFPTKTLYEAFVKEDDEESTRQGFVDLKTEAP